MYSEQDLRDAVAGGAISAEAAEALRSHVAQMRKMPSIDEENFRLINSFNDIFVAIGVVILLLAMGAVGQALASEIANSFYPSVQDTSDYWAGLSDEGWEQYVAYSALKTGLTALLGGALVAGTAWVLAEFFTKRRRMALPSILLLLAFIGGSFATISGAGFAMLGDEDGRSVAFTIAAAGLCTAGAAWLHWKRFMVPITVAAGTAAVAITVIALIAAAIEPIVEDLETLMLSIVFVAGLAVFAFAMRWDTSDRERQTRRSDVAFWLHLLAAPMIAHPIFALIGVIDNDDLGVGAAVGVLAVYISFGLIALAVDRRALLVSALAYVLIALTFLFERFGAVELTFALTALVIGSALLTLSAFWAPIRNAVVTNLPPSMRNRLPLPGGTLPLAA